MAQDYLDDCIQSILKQTYTNFELILIDDHSDDNSYNICKKYEMKDERIKLYKLDQNGGPSKARNFGLKIAKGEYISFVDSDDTIDKEMYEYLLNKNENFDIIIFSEKIMDRELNFLMNFTTLNEATFYNMQNALEVFVDLIFKYNASIVGHACNKLFNRSIIEDNDVKFFEDIDFAEDFMFNLHFFKYCRDIKLLNYRPYNRRKHFDSLSSKFREDLLFIVADNYKYVSSFLANNNVNSKYINDYYNWSLKHLVLFIHSTAGKKEIFKRKVFVLKKIYESDLYKHEIKKYLKFNKKEKISFYLIEHESIIILLILNRLEFLFKNIIKKLLVRVNIITRGQSNDQIKKL